MSEENGNIEVESQVVESEDVTAEDLEALMGDEGSDAIAVSAEGGEADLSDSAQEELQAAEQAVKDAASSKQKEAAKAKLEKVQHKYKLKVDGEDVDWEGSEEDLVRELQLSRKARKDIQKAREYEKEVRSLVELLKSNPAAVLSDPAIGIDVKEFAQKIINQELEEEMKSPDQRERERLEKELEEIRAKAKEESELRQKMEYERAVQEHETKLEEGFISALEESDMPNSPYLMKRMSDVMLTALEHDKQISPKQALNIVRKEMRKDLGEMFGASREEILEELLGSDVVKRFNKYQVSKYKKSQAVPSTKSIKDVGKSSKDRSEQEANKKPAKKQKLSDWMYS